MPRTCIFCDSTNLTDEHVWPEWVWRLFHKTPQANRYNVERHFTGRPSSRRRTSTIDLKERIACASCNNDWMSRLEKLAKAVLTPLILWNGIDRRLSLDDQAVLIPWAMTRALVCDFTTVKGAKRHYTQEQRVQFAEDFTPPTGMYIWAGQYVGTRRVHSTVTNIILRHKERLDVDYKGQITTLVVNRIVFQMLHVFTPDGAPPFEVNRAVPPDFDRAMIQLWPSDEIELTWPAAESLDDEALQVLATRLGVAPTDASKGSRS
jgi:hypothetical protein